MNFPKMNFTEFDEIWIWYDYSGTNPSGYSYIPSDSNTKYISFIYYLWVGFCHHSP